MHFSEIHIFEIYFFEMKFLMNLLMKPKKYFKNIMIMRNAIQIINFYTMKQVIVTRKLILIMAMEDIFVEIMENGIKIIV